MRRQLAAFLTATTIGISGSALALEEPGHANAAADAAAPVVTRGEQTEDPRIGYFVSETAEYGFVLDRTGEKGLLRFDQSVEILVLDMVPGPQGVTYLKDRLGTTILRLMPWGGATVYDADGTEGGAFGFRELANPLTLQPRHESQVQRRASQISQALSSGPGFEVVFRFEPDLGQSEMSRRGIQPETAEGQTVALAMAPGKGTSLASSGSSLVGSSSVGTLNDTLEVAGLALTRLASDELALEVMSERIASVTIRIGSTPGVSIEDQDLVVICVPERGLFGHPSSAEIERFLLENL